MPFTHRKTTTVTLITVDAACDKCEEKIADGESFVEFINGDDQIVLHRDCLSSMSAAELLHVMEITLWAWTLGDNGTSKTGATRIDDPRDLRSR